MNIIVTGASRGIGFSTALRFCRDGHHVIAIARDGKGLEKLEEEVRKSGYANNIFINQTDISNEAQLQGLFYQIMQMHDHIEVVINNAGALINKPFETIGLDELRRVYEVNVFAVFRFVQLLLPILGGERASHIVNIGSMGGVQGSSKFPGLSAYSSSKAALAGLTEVLAAELTEKNIKVNYLALGAVQTEMLQNAFPGYKGGCSPEQMASWICQFAVGGSELFNGKIIPVSSSTP